MRIIAWIKSRWYDHKAWKAFKRLTIATYGRAGFNTISYRGKPFIPDVITPSTTPQTTIVQSDPMTNSVNELVAAMNEADKQPPFNERAAKMDIINKKLGV